MPHLCKTLFLATSNVDSNLSKYLRCYVFKYTHQLIFLYCTTIEVKFPYHCNQDTEPVQDYATLFFSIHWILIPRRDPWVGAFGIYRRVKWKQKWRHPANHWDCRKLSPPQSAPTVMPSLITFRFRCMVYITEWDTARLNGYVTKYKEWL